MPPRRARSLVEGLIAHGREAGTPSAAEARGVISRFLSELGYIVQEQPFSFDAGIYRAQPAAGALLAGFSLLVMPLLLRGPAWGAAAALLVFMLATVITLFRLLSGKATPGTARVDANLIAHRGDAPVRCWLVAHLDTKAQGHSMAGRLVALWVTVLSLAGLVATAWLRLGAPQRPLVAAVVGALGVLAGVLLVGGRLEGQSPGARDNGSGLLAVLTAAELATDPGIGIIITGAEEFGLAGARALARERGMLLQQAEVLNVDTIDDEGNLFVVTHGDAEGLAGRVQARAAGLAPVRGRRLPLGILVDGVPLSRVAAASVTIGRLSWGTLRRMHTPRDDAAGYALRTAEQLGERLASPI